MKKIFVILMVFSVLSCKKKDECYPEFKESLSYIKEPIDPNDNKSRLVVEIHHNVKVLESISGVLNKNRGMNFLNIIQVSQDDVINWETWISEKCTD